MITPMKRAVWAAAATLTISISIVSGAQAQADYPNQAVKMLVGNTPGSASDSLGRVLATRLSQTLGQQFLIVNQPGAGGTIGAETVARAAPDGYTLYVTSTQAHAISPHLYPKAKYKPLEDFVAVTMVARTENILVVPVASPFKSVADLVAHAKANPGKLTIANAGPGSQSHLSGAMFINLAGIDLLQVPYKGAASVTAVLGAQNDVTIAPLPAVVGMMNGGKLRALAMGGNTRSKQLPELPTLAEAGVKTFSSGVDLKAADATGDRDSAFAEIDNAMRQLDREFNRMLPADDSAEALEGARGIDEHLLRWGFLDSVHPSDEIDRAALLLGERMAAQPRQIMQDCRRIFSALECRDQQAAEQIRAEAQVRNRGSS